MKTTVEKQILGILLMFIAASIVVGQIDQTIYYQYCVAFPDTSCFEPKNGAIDSVGRDVGALGGKFRICLQLDTIDSGFAPLRVLLVLDNSGSMCSHYGENNPDNCCVPGDGSGMCSKNDPENKRVEAAKMFVDSLRVLNPESEIGVIVYSSSVSSVLRPTPLTNDANVESIHRAIESAGCRQTTTGGGGTASVGMAKITHTTTTNLGIALQRALTEIDRNYQDMPQLMTRHIILLTDGAWDDITVRPPDSLIAAYKRQNPDRPVPKVHGVFLSDSITHVTHGYPWQGCSESGVVELGHLEIASSLTGGLYFGGSTPQTVVATFKTILDSVAQTAPQQLASLTVTNKTNGETRSNGDIRQIAGTPTWETTLQNLPVEKGSNELVFQYVVKKPGKGDSTVTVNVTIIRSDRYRESIDADLFKVYCELVQANIKITATPDMRLQNEPFNVNATISNAKNFTLDTVQARIITRFPDNESGVLATFHLDGDLKNASGNDNGAGTPSFTTTDYLFGSAAINSGSFSYSLPQITGAFVIEEWVKPGASAAAVLFSGGGIEIGVTAGMKLYLKSEGKLIDSSVVPLDDGVWSHIGIARSNNKVILFINGVAVSEGVEFTSPIGESAITVNVPSRWVVDEVRFSNTSRVTNDGATQILTLPTITTIKWNISGNESTSQMVKIAPNVWKNEGTSLDFQFSSPVAGRVIVNIRQKQSGGTGTGWSKNSNPVFVAADVTGPYVKQAVLMPGQLGAGFDTLKVQFSEPTLCEPIKSSTDPARSFTISRGASDRQDLLRNSQYVNFNECSSKFITEVTLLVPVGLLPDSTDSIRLINEKAVDTAGNAPQINRKGDIVWGPGADVEIISIQSKDKQKPMEIDPNVQKQLGITENNGKPVAIITTRPFEPIGTDPKTGKKSFGTATIYDAVGNLVAVDLSILEARLPRTYYVVWDGTNRNKRRVAPGTYLVRFYFNYAGGAKGMRDVKIGIRW